MDHLVYAKEIAEKINIDKIMLNNNSDNSIEQELKILIKKGILVLVERIGMGIQIKKY